MRLIDADMLKEKLFIEGDNWNPVVTENEIDEEPTVDAVPVVRGEWKEETTCFFFIYRCSKCNASTWLGKTNFCPNCGADMRGEK